MLCPLITCGLGNLHEAVQLELPYTVYLSSMKAVKHIERRWHDNPWGSTSLWWGSVIIECAVGEDGQNHIGEGRNDVFYTVCILFLALMR